jgi:hypothetical protein
VDPDFESVLDPAEASEEGMESGEEVLPRLFFGGGEGCDGGLAIHEHVHAGEARRARDNVEG